MRHAFAAAVESRFGLAGPARRRRAVAIELRRALEELGPTFVKLGQVASVRADVFGPDTLEELEKLQDSVPAVPVADIEDVIERSLGAPAELLLDGFDREALAAASIAQVHRARLKAAYRPVWGPQMPAGTDVVVKVVRPGARVLVGADIAAARAALERVPRIGPLNRIDLTATIDELESSIRRELDMRIEGRTADRFAFDFRDDAVVRIPRVVWPLTTRDVLVMEYVQGWPLSKLDAAREAGVDTRGLAEHGASAFMRQVLVVGRYHADLHHANLLVTPEEQIAYLDFGMVGHLDRVERRAVAHLLASLVYHDSAAAVRWTEAMGARVPPESVGPLSDDLSALMSRTLNSGESDVRDFGTGLLRLLRKHRVSMPSGYALLVKALVTVEGVSRKLYPDIDMMAMAAPFVTSILVDEALTADALYRRAPAALRAALRVLLEEEVAS